MDCCCFGSRGTRLHDIVPPSANTNTHTSYPSLSSSHLSHDKKNNTISSSDNHTVSKVDQEVTSVSVLTDERMFTLVSSWQEALVEYERVERQFLALNGEIIGKKYLAAVLENPEKFVQEDEGVATLSRLSVNLPGLSDVEDIVTRMSIERVSLSHLKEKVNADCVSSCPSSMPSSPLPSKTNVFSRSSLDLQLNLDSANEVHSETSSVASPLWSDAGSLETRSFPTSTSILHLSTVTGGSIPHGVHDLKPPLHSDFHATSGGDGRAILLLSELANRRLRVLETEHEMPHAALERDASTATALYYFDSITTSHDLSDEVLKPFSTQSFGATAKPDIQLDAEPETGGKFTRLLANIWSRRLNETEATAATAGVSPRYSGSSTNSAEDRDSSLLQWPSFLNDMTFEVVKVNKYGHRMPRALHLTPHHISSLRDSIVTKVWSYLSIERLWLQDATTLKLLERNGAKHMFITPLAAALAQQLVTRIKVRRSIDAMQSRKSFAVIRESSYNGENSIVNAASDAVHGTSGGVFTSRMIAGMIAAISEENAFSTEDVLASFAAELTERTLRSIDASEATAVAVAASRYTLLEDRPTSLELTPTEQIECEANISETRWEDPEWMKDDMACDPQADVVSENNFASSNTDSLDEATNISSQSSVRESLPSRPLSIAVVNDNNAVSRSSFSAISSSCSTKINELPSSPSLAGARLSVFTDGSPEYHIHTLLRTLVFDVTTPEGNTRRAFVEQFLKDSSADLHLGADSGCILNEFTQRVRNFVDGLHEYILTERGLLLALEHQRVKQAWLAKKATSNSSELNASSSSSLIIPTQNWTVESALATLTRCKDSGLTLQDMDEAVLVLVSFIIFLVVEESVCLPLRHRITALLTRSPSYAEEESKLVMKIKIFARRNQKRWGVPDNFISPLNWQSAIFELSSLEANLTPTTQLQVLTRTVKAIYAEYKLAVIPMRESKGLKVDVIAADDLVPIFLYVLCQCRTLTHPLLNRDLMWSFCHPDQLHGEAGYYLTVYESALEFLLAETLHDLDAGDTLEDILVSVDALNADLVSRHAIVRDVGDDSDTESLSSRGPPSASRGVDGKLNRRRTLAGAMGLKSANTFHNDDLSEALIIENFK